MGFRVSWIAAREAKLQPLLNCVELELTGERHDCPDVGFYLLSLPPWNIVIADGSENFDAFDEDLAKDVSKNAAEVLFFWCSDTVMTTELCCFRAGALVWSVQYVGEDGPNEPPTLQGATPPVVQKLLSELMSEQRATDEEEDFLYELTANIGRALTGFRHDMVLEVEDDAPFQVLEPA